MIPWHWNLLLGSVGLLLAASVAWVLLRLWHRQPLTSYRLLVAVLPDAAERHLEHWMPESPS